MPGRRELCAFVALAAAVRALVAWRTAMPSRDGATHLWMAEQIAAGDPIAAFATVFHPLYPLLIGALLAVCPALDAFTAGQIVGGGCGALAVAPLLAMAAHRFGPAAGRAAALLYAFGLWFARHPAEAASEGVFYAAVALWAWALFGARLRPLLGGAAAAAAYATRPEGVALAAVGALRLARSRPTAAVAFAACAAALSAAVPLGYLVLGDGFTLTPKASFNYAIGVGAASDPAAHVAVHAVRALGTAFEAIGYVAFPLAVAGVVLVLRSPATRADAWLAAPFALQAAVVPLLHSHLRFLSGFGILLLPFAGVALARACRPGRVPSDGLPEPVPERRRPGGLLPAPQLQRAAPRWCLPVLLSTALLPDLARLPAARGHERLIERQLGAWLAARLRPGEFIATEMPRLEYFAGQRPGPPRVITRDELLAAAAAPNAPFAVVVAGRSGIDAEDLARLGFRPVSLPDELSTLARTRGLLVYERR
ncbi:MAG TPA: hypothetical protein VK081_06850 [Planctomycetota bacterium]|nr:hypothetical protein [Planctomycetota bacterium]